MATAVMEIGGYGGIDDYHLWWSILWILNEVGLDSGEKAGHSAFVPKIKSQVRIRSDPISRTLAIQNHSFRTQ